MKNENTKLSTNRNRRVVRRNKLDGKMKSLFKKTKAERE